MTTKSKSPAELSIPWRGMAKLFKSKRHCGNCESFDLDRGQALLVQISPRFAHGVLPHVSADKMMRKIEAYQPLNEAGAPKVDEHGNPVIENRDVIPEGDSGARWVHYGACSNPKVESITWAKYTCPNWT